MVEIQKKYNLKVNKFGFINFVGFISLYSRECSRFFVVWAQTLLSPLVSSLLFLSVLSLALGNERGDVLDRIKLYSEIVTRKFCKSEIAVGSIPTRNNL